MRSRQHQRGKLSILEKKLEETGNFGLKKKREKEITTILKSIRE